MIKFLSTCLLLFALFFSLGEIEKCSASECSSTTAIEICQLCRNCSSVETPLRLAFDSGPQLLFEIQHSFQNTLVNLYRPERLFRPPISHS